MATRSYVVKRGGKYYERTRSRGGATRSREISRSEGEAAFKIAKITGSASQTAKNRSSRGSSATFKGTNILKPVVTKTVDKKGNVRLTSVGEAVEKERKKSYFKGTNLPKPVILSKISRGKRVNTAIGTALKLARKRQEKEARQRIQTLKKKYPGWKKESLKKGWGPLNFEGFLLYKDAEARSNKALNGLAGRRIVVKNELDFLKKKVYNLGKIKIGNVSYTPRTPGERRFFEKIKRVVDRENRFKKSFLNAQKALGIDIQNRDKWYIRALKGGGQNALGFIYGGGFIVNALDKALLTGQGLFMKGASKKSIGKELGFAARKTPGVVVKQYDPSKPENWAGILLTIAGVRAGAKALVRVRTRTSRYYVPSVKNAGVLERALSKRLRQVRVSKALARANIKAKVTVSASKRLLSKLNKMERVIIKSRRVVNKIIKDPKVLKLEDMNPLIQTSKLLREMGKVKTVYHASGVPFRKIFGQTYDKLRSTKSILRAVRRASGSVKRNLSAFTGLEKNIIAQLRRVRAIVTGGRAQNTFVKGILKRNSKDFDVLVRNNSKAARSVVRALKKKYPGADIKLSSMSKIGSSGKRIRVYSVKFNGKKILDFVNSRDVKGLKTAITKKGNLVARSDFLALQKLRALKDLKAWRRYPKDMADLKRLANATFNKKKIVETIRNPKNVFTARAQPKGMGASRIKFGETQIFFDFEVPTGYAFNSLAKNVISPKLLKFLEKVKVPRFSKKTTAGVKKPGIGVFKKAFVKKLNNLKYVKANDRYTIFKVRKRISSFPRELASRMRKAARGQLSKSQGVKLRRDINSYINKNPNKAFVGSRTGSMPRGEREIVFAENSKFVARKSAKPSESLKRGVTIDPDTKILADVIELGIKKAPKKVPYLKRVKAALKRFRKEPFSSVKRRFRKGDFMKIKRFKRILKRADKLTDPQYKDLIEITRRMLKSKRASKGVKVGKKASKRVRRRSGVRVKKSKESITRALAGKKVSKSTKRKSVKSVKTSRRLVSPKRVKSRAGRKVTRLTRRVTVRRSTIPARSRKRSSVRKRSTSKRKPKRVVSRVSNRVVSRPRVRARARPRPRLRSRVRPRARPRVNPRVLANLRKRVPVRLRHKATTRKDKEAVLKWLLRQPVKYRPSLVAILFNITSYKIPKRITGFEIRPIIRRRR